jgi:two-component system, NtrC family, response regulator HydG
MPQDYELVGGGHVMRALREEIDHAAKCEAKVLLTGESGTGKELVARAIHQASGRRGVQLVTVNCAALSDTLLESELFGHARGSFTGAYRDRRGLFEVAHGGSLFMDEIGEMSPRMQSALLRLLETGEIQRVGSDRPAAHVDVRVIAATNRNLFDAVSSGGFREDLYYRLNVIQIRVPALRERRDDIPLLVDHFARAYANQYHTQMVTFAPAVIDALQEHNWPGNVRQLRNVVERLAVRSRPGQMIELDELVVDIDAPPAPVASSPPLVSTARNVDELLHRMFVDRESFWTAVRDPFMARDLTRDDLRAIVSAGLQRTAGNYRLLIRMFNMPPTDYKRFLAFLTTYDCHVAFQPYRAAVGRGERTSWSDRVPA